MSDPFYTLVGLDICLFVQRSQILLAAKGMQYRAEFIDIADKPDWFLTRVPTGKVPALSAGQDPLFGSNVINEYVDEVTQPWLLG